MKAFKWILIIAIILLVVWWVFLRETGSDMNVDGATVMITDEDWAEGPADAPVQLIEYGDFQCPFCSQYHLILKQLQTEFPDQIRLAYRQFPLTQIHQNALISARAAEAAGRQGKFWEMHDLLFEHQEEWANSLGVVEMFEAFATQIGLDLEQYRTDLDDDAIVDKIRDSVREGIRLGVSSTPSFYLNGELIQNPPTYEGFAALISETLAPEPSGAFGTPEPNEISGGGADSATSEPDSSGESVNQ